MNTEQAPASLSAKLRQSTMREHRETEGTSFIKSLFQGTCSEKDYVSYLWALAEVYESLEQGMELNKNHPAVSRVYFPELFRLSALKQDLQIWSQQFLPEITRGVRSAVASYSDRIKLISTSNPNLLVAHAYVRYLGDLSGGQMLGQSLNKRFPQNKGMNFYSYSIADADQMKTLYRSRLDEIGSQSDSVTQEICTEAQAVFKYNELVFDALAVLQ